MEHRILHLDMDAFYASVETLDDPSLAGKPLLVGGHGPRSVVAACSYEARRFGIHSAMPMRMALERCPHATLVRPRMNRYREISEAVFARLQAVTPQVERTSIDEGYMNIGELAPDNEAALALGERLRADIRESLGLSCSVGIAPCKFVAKIASDLRKPAALVLVRGDEVDAFLAPLDVDRIPGVGKVGRRKLHALGVRTVADLRAQTLDMLTSLFGKWGARLHDFARGIDPRPVVTETERQSLGTEKTFDRDVSDLVSLRATLADQAAQVAEDLAESGEEAAATVTVKVRYSDFTTVTRQRSYERPVKRAGEIAAIANDLLARTEAGRRPVRLIGLTVSGFAPEADTQDELPLFDMPEPQKGTT
jgi:DNA polymerase-4